MQENKQMYPVLNCLSGDFIQKWEVKSQLEKRILHYFKIYQNGCVSNMINILGANSSLACIPQWATSFWYPVSSFLLFCSWRKCSLRVNTAGFSRAVGRQSLLVSSSLTQEGKTGSSETLWIILAVVTYSWPSYVGLIRHVCLLKAYPNTLLFYFWKRHCR